MSFALSVIAKASMILTAAAAASILLCRASAAVKHAVWVFAIAGTVLVPLTTALFRNCNCQFCRNGQPA